MEQKAKVVFELDRDSVQAACFFMNEKLTDEMWQAIISEEILLSPDDLGGDGHTAKIAFSLIAIAKAVEKIESSGHEKG